MSKKQPTYVNPFLGSGSWTRYQMKFSVPSTYEESSDWTLAIDAGNYGYKETASAREQQTFYLDSISLSSEEEDDIILLTDNIPGDSPIHLYSDKAKQWIKNYIDWPSANAKPVYTHINNAVRISDANFQTSNNNYTI